MTVTRRSRTPAPAPLPAGPGPVTRADLARAGTNRPVTAAAGLTYEAVRGDHPDFKLTPEQVEVNWFGDNVGWAAFYVQIKAMLGSLCPWIPLKREGNEWVPVVDGRHAGIIDAIRPPTRSQTGLRFRSLRLQAKIGEHAMWPVDVAGRGLTFDIAHPNQLMRSPSSTELFGVKTRRDATPSSPVGWAEFPRDRLRRHWIADDEWPDEATSSLMPVLPEMGLYRDMVLALRRTAQSRLLMNGLLYVPIGEDDEVGNTWSSDDAGGAFDPSDSTPSTPEEAGGLEELLKEYARYGARAFRDHAGNDVAAQLPFPFPHHSKPEHVTTSEGIKKEHLETLTEVVFAGARALDIPTQFLVSGEASANSWGDAELRRALHERGVFPELERNNEFWTDHGYRPLLALSRAGGLALGDDDPNDYKLGCDTTVLDVRSDSLQSIALALAQGVGSRQWAASKLGVPISEMLELPVEVEDYDHWLSTKASAARAQAEATSDFPELAAVDGLPGLPAGEGGEGSEPVRDVTPRAPEPAVAAALRLIAGRGR